MYRAHFTVCPLVSHDFRASGFEIVSVKFDYLERKPVYYIITPILAKNRKCG